MGIHLRSTYRMVTSPTSAWAGTAGLGDVTIFIVDHDFPDCNISVVVQDPVHCSVTCNIEIINLIVIGETCPGDNNGSITFNANCMDCGVLEYSIDGLNWQNIDAFFTNLAPGDYTVETRDINDHDCITSFVATINPGDGDAPIFDQSPILPQECRPSSAPMMCHQQETFDCNRSC